MHVEFNCKLILSYLIYSVYLKFRFKFPCFAVNMIDSAFHSIDAGGRTKHRVDHILWFNMYHVPFKEVYLRMF